MTLKAAHKLTEMLISVNLTLKVVWFAQTLKAALASDYLRHPLRFTRTRTICTLYTRTNVYKFSFLPRVVTEWNNFSIPVVNLSTHPIAFK